MDEREKATAVSRALRGPGRARVHLLHFTMEPCNQKGEIVPGGHLLVSHVPWCNRGGESPWMSDNWGDVTCTWCLQRGDAAYYQAPPWKDGHVISLNEWAGRGKPRPVP